MGKNFKNQIDAKEGMRWRNVQDVVVNSKMQKVLKIAWAEFVKRKLWQKRGGLRVKIQRLKMKIEIDLGICGEFEELIQKVDTVIYKEVNGGKVTLFPEYDTDLVYIMDDILKLKSKANYINFIYQMFDYPYQAIEFIKDIEEAEKYAQRKREFQEKLFGFKYSEEQYLQLVVETFHQLRFSKYTFERAVNEVGHRNQRWYGIG